MSAILLLAGVVVGYGLGRWQPGRRACDWADWLMYSSRPVTRRDWRWWAAQPVYACEIAVMLAIRPRVTVRAWRHRNDPPPACGPAPTIDPNWAKHRSRHTDAD